MFDNIRPYELKRIQIDHSPKINELFEECFIYKFFTDEQTKGGKTRYIASTNRFTFKGVIKVILTCAKLIPEMMEIFPNASFVIKASEGIDLQTNTEEQESNNQRFRIYKYALNQVIGNENFQHYEYPDISVYFLINKRDCDDLEDKHERIKKELIGKFNLVDL